MKNSIILASVLLSALVSASAFASSAAQARFDGACAGGGFSASGTDIEYFDLNLDLDNTGSKECVITTTLPARSGFRINVSSFKAEAFADLRTDGLAILTVNHRFNGQLSEVYRSVAKESGALVAQQTAIGISSCGQPVELRTKVATKSVNATLLQDSAVSNTVSYRILYVPCH